MTDEAIGLRRAGVWAHLTIPLKSEAMWELPLFYRYLFLSSFIVTTHLGFGIEGRKAYEWRTCTHIHEVDSKATKREWR